MFYLRSPNYFKKNKEMDYLTQASNFYNGKKGDVPSVDQILLLQKIIHFCNEYYEILLYFLMFVVIIIVLLILSIIGSMTLYVGKKYYDATKSIVVFFKNTFLYFCVTFTITIKTYRTFFIYFPSESRTQLYEFCQKLFS